MPISPMLAGAKTMLAFARIDLAFRGYDVDVNRGHVLLSGPVIAARCRSHKPLLLVLLRVLDRFVNAAAVSKGLLRDMIVVAIDDAVEAANGFRQRDVLAGRVREDFRDRRTAATGTSGSCVRG